MSARIAPKAGPVGIAFSPQLPKFVRSHKRDEEDELDKKMEDEAANVHVTQLLPQPSAGVAQGALPSATIFEAAILADRQAAYPLSPYEVARRMEKKWSPPASTFPLTDKVI